MYSEDIAWVIIKDRRVSFRNGIIFEKSFYLLQLIVVKDILFESLAHRQTNGC